MRAGVTATSMIRSVAIALFACALSDARALGPDYAREDRIVAENRGRRRLQPVRSV